MTHPLQNHIPYDPFADRPLPGIGPTTMAGWLVRDDAYAGQMAERDRLVAQRPDAVLAMDAAARPAAEELLEVVLDGIGAGETVRRPDGVLVAVDRTRPMATLARLVQEDFCILERRDNEHVLTAAALCFPASWMLAEKFGKPLIGIHEPVAAYDAGIAARVQRLFDGVRPGAPLWRFNRLWYVDPDLHQPRSEGQRRPKPEPGVGGYLRSERQCLVRLPRTRAVVFSIHTYVMTRAAVLAQGLDPRDT
ncbi:MAG: DUF3445 domain-containing protein [Pseudooceanicola sp.]|nr:DUF3445 domain-containing protein [Pseudooceanicola sp.]